MKKTLNIAVVLAAGSGLRSSLNEPKQLVKLAGRPLLDHVLSVFQACSVIDKIIVVTNQNCLEKIQNLINQRTHSKVEKVLLGGKERYESSLVAIQSCQELSKKYHINLIFHDAVRPLLSNKTIKKTIEALKIYKAVDVVVQTTDTIIETIDGKTISSIPARNNLRNGQTPQAFHYSIIELAYQLAIKDKNFQVTDDCGIVKKYLPKVPIGIVEGERTNIKLTYKEDLLILDKFIQTKSIEVGSIKGAIAKDSVCVIFGGTSGIGLDISKILSSKKINVISVGKTSGVDISSFNQVKRFLAQVHSKFGRIDFVINTAAELMQKSMSNMSIKEIDRLIKVNYYGAIYVAKSAYEYLKNSKGHLIFFTSSSYTYGRAYYGIYSSTKAAIVNLTQALSDEWTSDGIRVNCINPERTATPMRVKNFGVEPKNTLLTSKFVARETVKMISSNVSGQVFDIKKIL